MTSQNAERIVVSVAAPQIFASDPQLDKTYVPLSDQLTDKENNKQLSAANCGTPNRRTTMESEQKFGSSVSEILTRL